MINNKSARGNQHACVFAVDVVNLLVLLLLCSSRFTFYPFFLPNGKSSMTYGTMYATMYPGSLLIHVSTSRPLGYRCDMQA